MRHVIGAGLRSARRTELTGSVSFTCAEAARASTGGRCRLRAGRSGLLACTHWRRKQATAWPRMQHSDPPPAWLHHSRLLGRQPDAGRGEAPGSPGPDGWPGAE